MSPQRTWVLAAVVAALLIVDVAAHQLQPTGPEALPEVTAIEPALATRIVIDKGDTHLELEQTDGQWRITQPEALAMAADALAVEAVLEPIASGIAMDVPIDEGAKAQKDYGLKPPDEIRVRVEAGPDRVADFYVGNNAAGGSTFVRLPGNETVYRARIGGRARYDRTPSRWRDLGVFHWEPDELASLSVTLPDGTSWTAARTVDLTDDGAVSTGRWELQEDPTFAVDQAMLDQLAKGLGQWRSVQLLAPDHDAGLDRPVATLTAQLTTQAVHQVRIGQVGGAAFAQREAGKPVYQIQPSILSIFADPAAAWRDKQLVDLEPTAVTAMSLITPEQTIVMGRVDGQWQILEPAGLATNQVQAQQLANLLAQMRVDAWAPADAPGVNGLSGHTAIVVETATGDRRITVGGAVPGQPEGQEAVFVRLEGGPVGLVRAATWEAVRRAFGG